jgi:hypothetical protein
MTNRQQEVLERLRAVLAASRADGGVVSTTHVSMVLLAEFPDCGINPDDLENLVAKEAARGGVAVSIDGHP